MQSGWNFGLIWSDDPFSAVLTYLKATLVGKSQPSQTGDAIKGAASGAVTGAVAVLFAGAIAELAGKSLPPSFALEVVGGSALVGGVLGWYRHSKMPSDDGTGVGPRSNPASNPGSSCSCRIPKRGAVVAHVELQHTRSSKILMIRVAAARAVWLRRHMHRNWTGFRIRTIPAVSAQRHSCQCSSIDHWFCRFAVMVPSIVAI